MAWTEKYASPTGAGLHDGSSPVNAWDLSESIAGIVGSDRVNFITGTYAETTNLRTFNTAGTATAPIWLRGYDTVIGDLDDVPVSQRTPGTDMPLFTFTTGRLRFGTAADFYIMSSIAVTSATTTEGSIYIAGTPIHFRRIRVDHTGTTSGVEAVYCNVASGYQMFEGCHFLNTSDGAVVTAFSRPTFHGCIIEGGDDGIVCDDSPRFIGNIFDSQGGHCLNLGEVNNPTVIIGNSFYNNGTTSDAIYLSSLPAQTTILNNVFSTIKRYAINNASGADSIAFYIASNLYHSITTGQLNGITESVQFDALTDSSSPFTDAANQDFTIVDGSNAIAAGSPGMFEKTGPTTYLDLGAVQREEPAGGGGTTIITRPRRVM